MALSTVVGSVAMNVVLHLSNDQPAAGAEALANLSNLIADETVDTEAVALVTNAGAIQHLKTTADYADQIRSLLERDVSFSACSNSLQALDVMEDDLIDGVEVVSSGVGELARLEADGYHYMKVP
jgi:intracellular sulfur oxidation DsrE/DsrF family protein